MGPPPADTRTTRQALCRDCLAWFPGQPTAAVRRCAHCRSPRVIAHPELDNLAIAHIDCDAFYASVEKRDDPSLADRPVIVGGGRRGVVATCCYVARIYGVRSAMPMFKALRACPQAVVIAPNMDKYVRVGRQIRALMLELTPLVEPLSIDEAFLDLSGTAALHRASPALTLARFARRVESEIGVTVSIGLAPNKFLAKVASDLDKPRGFKVIGQGEAVAFLADQPIAVIPGAGKVTQERLATGGIRTLGDVQRLGERALARLYGEEGLRLARLAFGRDERRVSPERETKSISSETTFHADIDDPERLVAILLRLCERVAYRLKRADLAGRTVTLKLKSADFRVTTRARSLQEPTQLASRLFEAGRDLLLKECRGRSFRLIGIGVSELGPGEDADRGDLVDADIRRAVRMEQAIDRLRERFGQEAVERGLSFRERHRP